RGSASAQRRSSPGGMPAARSWSGGCGRSRGRIGLSRTIRPMATSTDSTGRVREHFRRKAFSFDRLYDEEHALQRTLRPGLFNRREFALQVASEYDAPRVLDVGGGSARIGELMLEHGASRYVDIDLSDSMLELAKNRLTRFEDEQVTLIQGDFLR